MNYSIKSILLHSLAKIWPWIQISLIGLIIGISICGFWIWLNPNAKFISLGIAIHSSTFWEITKTVIIEIIKALFIIIICLFIPTNKYCAPICKILILLISVYLGIIFVLFIKSGSSNYLPIIYLGAQEFSIIWCFSIGTLKTELIKKTKLAIMPFLLLMAISISQIFFG